MYDMQDRMLKRIATAVDIWNAARTPAAHRDVGQAQKMVFSDMGHENRMEVLELARLILMDENLRIMDAYQ